MNTGGVARHQVQVWRGLGWVSLPAIGALSVAAQWAGRSGARTGRDGLGSLLLPDLALGSGAVGSGSRAGLVMLAACATLVLALASVGNLVLRAVGEERPGRRFVRLWIGSAAAALLTTGSALLGGVVAASGGGPPTRSAVFAAAAQATMTCGYWTATWGLAGAAVTAWLGPPRPLAAMGALLHVRIAVAAGLVLATVVAAGGLAAAVAAARSAPTPPIPAPRPASSAPVPSAEPSDPALLTNPDPDPAFRGRCPAKAIAVSYLFADAAAGRRFGLLTATNTSGKPCTLKGYPDLAFADVEDNNVRVKFKPGRWDGSEAKVRAVVLEAGGKARAELTWRGDAGAYDREVDTILAAPWAGAKRTPIVDRFDIKNGSGMQVSPWLPTV